MGEKKMHSEYGVVTILENKNDGKVSVITEDGIEKIVETSTLSMLLFD